MKNNYKTNRKTISDEKNKYYFLGKTAFKSEPTDVRQDIYLKTGPAFRFIIAKLVPSTPSKRFEYKGSFKPLIVNLAAFLI